MLTSYRPTKVFSGWLTGWGDGSTPVCWFFLMHARSLRIRGTFCSVFLSMRACVNSTCQPIVHASFHLNAGVDPGDYSRTLMRVACEFADDPEKFGEVKEKEHWPEALRKALAAAHQKTRMPGSSTACLVGLHPSDSVISSINLGDSGYVLIRNGTTIFRSPPLVHYFDCPYQLGAYPEHVDQTDYPTDGEAHTMYVMEGDTIVLASDGLWDNCTLEEIAQLVPDSDDAVADAAEIIASTAREHAGMVKHWQRHHGGVHNTAVCLKYI